MHPAIDANGKNLQIGDWVRVIAVPLTIRGMPNDSLQAFSSAVGYTFQIESFGETGCLELDLWPKISLDTIWVEPYCVVRTRRYQKLSRQFVRTLAIKDGSYPPRYEVEFVVQYAIQVDPEQIGLDLATLGCGGGFSIELSTRTISGSTYIEKSRKNSKKKIAGIKDAIWDIDGVTDATVSDPREI